MEQDNEKLKEIYDSPQLSVEALTNWYNSKVDLPEFVKNRLPTIEVLHSEVNNMKELQDKAVELGQQVSNLCNEVAALQNMIGQYDYDLEQIDQEVMNQVLSATDNTGKPLYTNDTQRKTQHKLMLYNHEKYQSLRAQREDIKDQERQILWTLNGLKAQIKTLDIATR